VRKDGWLPFHEEARGFGGEEMVSGVRYRKAGRQGVCVPRARWWHYFDRPYDGQGSGAAPYRLVVHDKIRNYFLEMSRLGLDLTPLREHFVPQFYPLSEWEKLLQGEQWPHSAAPDVTPGTFIAERP